LTGLRRPMIDDARLDVPGGLHVTLFQELD
jgi:hypothetical protein